MPEGAIRINALVSRLAKDGQVTWFVGADSYFAHPAGASAGQRLALATLMVNGHARPCQIPKTLGIAPRSLARWRKQLVTQGAGSFYQPRGVRGAAVLTAETSAQCQRLLDEGHSIAATARLVGINDSTLRKAIAAGRITQSDATRQAAAPADGQASTKSRRSRIDAEAADGIGTACTRAEERSAAAFGLADGTATRFEPATDRMLGGVLCGLPALCANGLFSGLGATSRAAQGLLPRPAHPLRARLHGAGPHPPPRATAPSPAWRTRQNRRLGPRARSAHPAGKNRPHGRHRQPRPMDARTVPNLDGKRPRASRLPLPRRPCACLSRCGRPPAAPLRLAPAPLPARHHRLLDQRRLGQAIFRRLQSRHRRTRSHPARRNPPRTVRKRPPPHPTPEQLAAGPLLHRFIVVFDREGSHHGLLARLWEQRVGVITYRKNVTETWPEDEFAEVEVACPGGGSLAMRLATRESEITARNAAPVPILEVRRLTDSGHQTAIITTARTLASPAVAGRMFSRWCRENYFAYMMEHYDIDGLVEYGSEEIPGATSPTKPRHVP